MLIGNRSAPLSVLLFAAVWGGTDKKNQRIRWIDSAGTTEKGGETEWSGEREGESVGGAPWGYLPLRRNMKNQ